MAQFLTAGIPAAYLGIIVAIIAVAAVAYRVYSIKHADGMHAKCPKCGAIFNASGSMSIVHVGPIKQIKCPKCGKISFMNTNVKEPITYPPSQQNAAQTTNDSISEVEQKRRIEESKYEKPQHDE
jgi:ribosomal protein S27AE